MPVNLPSNKLSSAAVAARHDHQAAVGVIDVFQHQQRRDDVVIAVRSVHEVLMVMDAGRRARQFDVQLAVVIFDVWANQIGDHVDHWRVAHHLKVGVRHLRRIVATAQGRSVGAVFAPGRGRPSAVGGPKGAVWAAVLDQPASAV